MRKGKAQSLCQQPLLLEVYITNHSKPDLSKGMSVKCGKYSYRLNLDLEMTKTGQHKKNRLKNRKTGQTAEKQEKTGKQAQWEP